MVGGTIKERAYFHAKQFLGIFLYLWVVLALFSLHKSMILAEHHIHYSPYGFALINALALGKVIMVAKEFHFADHFKDRPLIYPTLLKSAAFATLLMCFELLEKIAVGLFHGRTVQETLSTVGDRGEKGLVSMGLLLFFMLIPFFGFTELSLLFGEGKLATAFFKSRRHWVMREEISPEKRSSGQAER